MCRGCSFWEFLKHEKPLSAFLRMMAQQTFPPPPWERTSRLRPIKSSPDLHEVEDKFENCPIAMTGSAICCEFSMAGEDVYNRSGSEKALVELVQFSSIGWYSNYARIMRNDGVSCSTQRQLHVNSHWRKTSAGRDYLLDQISIRRAASGGSFPRAVLSSNDWT
jgi:hypothetical protein